MRAHLRLLPILIGLAGLSLAGNCGNPFFEEPLAGQLSLTGGVDWTLRLPALGVVQQLDVTLEHPDGSLTPVAPVGVDDTEASGALDLSTEGDYTLHAEVRSRVLFANVTYVTQAAFELTELQNPDDCEILNDVECLLPYPSLRFTREDVTSPTGFRLEVAQEALPQPNGPPIPASLVERLDGFSPTVQILMHIPGGVNVEQSDASRLQAVGTGPPWVDTRAHDDRSLDADSPTVLLHYPSGERVLHWTEVDARATGPERQAFILRPAVSLTPGERYVVAVRSMKNAAGETLPPEPVFETLRDGRPSTIPALEERRPRMDALLEWLDGQGVGRADLQLAFEFVTQSDHGLTHQMLTMREKAFDWFDAQTQTADDNTFTVQTVQDFDCSNPGQVHRRIVTGTFRSPLFLESVPTNMTVPQIHADPVTDEPLLNGTMDAPFSISIPCALFEEDGPAVQTILLGHGIFGTGAGMVTFVPPNAKRLLGMFDDTGEWHYIAGATNWTGWSNVDFNWVGGFIVGVGTSALHNFPAFPDRHRQGQVNTLILSRMLDRGTFNVDPNFQLDLGSGVPEGVFPGDTTEHYYYGISMGGVQGLFHAALSPDIEKYGIDVGSINFSLLLQRSTQFDPPDSIFSFNNLLVSIGLADPMIQILGVQLLHELWVAAEPAGYATHITSNRLDDDGNPTRPPAKILMTPAWLDHQVSNHGTEITARTLGLTSLHGSFQQQLVGIPDAAPGAKLDSALVMYDTGLDITNPDHQPFIPPLSNTVVEIDDCDPHGARPSIPAGVQQLVTFLSPGGQIENFCDGICDSSGPFEIDDGDASVCDPL